MRRRRGKSAPLRVVGYRVHHWCVVGAWFFYHYPHDVSTTCFVRGMGFQMGEVKEGGRVRRIYMRASRFKLFPFLVAFFGYFLSLLTESNIKNAGANNAPSAGGYRMRTIQFSLVCRDRRPRLSAKVSIFFSPNSRKNASSRTVEDACPYNKDDK